MDIMKEFEEYLPKWAEEKNQPLPTKELSDRWTVAWLDFVKEVLTPRRSELIADYKAMTLKTFGDLDKEKAKEEEKQKKEEQIEQHIVEETKELTEWEKVKAMLNKN